MDLNKAKLAAEAASVEVAVAARNEQIRAAIAAGMSRREIEATTGIPRSTVQRIGSARPLTEAEYLQLANNEAVARAEVVALESVAATLAETDSSTEA
jgi:hypothetical protein